VIVWWVIVTDVETSVTYVVVNEMYVPKVELHVETTTVYENSV